MPATPDFGPLPKGVETPAVLVDAARLAANIRRGAAIAAQAGVSLRPHIKTHKSLAIARMQLDAGAVGITASKTDEALVFIRGGVPSVTCAYPVIDACKLDRLVAAAKEHGCDLRLMADSDAAVTALHEAGERSGAVLPVFLKIDVGLHRCGLEPDDPRLPRLAGRIHGSPHLTFGGILSHAGHSYGASHAAEVQTIAREEAAAMRGVRDVLLTQGIPVPCVSVGATPTVLAADDFEGVNELRPGNYVFMDRTPVRLGLCDEADVALTVLATVVSVNDRYALVDAGSKVLSSDGGAHGAKGAGGFGLAWTIPAEGAPMTVARLSEEHGWLSHEGNPPRIGSQVRILPNHSCVVANLARDLLLVDERGARALRVDARARTL